MDFELPNPPSDAISRVFFSDTQPTLLVVSSWDKSVRLYDAMEHGTGHKDSYSHRGAVLDACLVGENVSYSGGLDMDVLRHDWISGVTTTLCVHKQPVKSIIFDSAKGCVMSGGWDAVVKMVDERDRSSEVDYVVPERVYSMSLAGEKLVVAMANREIYVYDTRNMSEPFQKRESSLKFQTRTVGCFPNAQGYAIASIEGRVGVEYFDPTPAVQKQKYAFKCHRQVIDGVDTIYPVHSISFHPTYGTFATGGGDGVINIWDGFSKKRLRQFTGYPTSISSLSFNNDGSMLAVASSYSYEEGDKDHPPDTVFVKMIDDADVRPKSLQ